MDANPDAQENVLEGEESEDYLDPEAEEAAGLQEEEDQQEAENQEAEKEEVGQTCHVANWPELVGV